MKKRNKIRLLFTCCYLYGLSGIPIKDTHVKLLSTEKIFFSILFSVATILIVVVLIKNYKKLLSYWQPKNKQQEMAFLNHFTLCVVFLISIASYGLVWRI